MKLISCIYLIFISVFSVWANTDSLVYKLNDGAFKIRYSNPDSSLIFASQAYSLSLKQENRYEEMRSLNNMANHFRIVNSYDEAISKFHEAEKVAASISETLFLAKILNNIGLTFKNSSQFDSAIVYFHKAIETNSSNNQKKYSLHNIGETYRLIQKYEEALESFNKCYKIFEAENDTLGIAKIKNSLGNVYYDQEIYDSALILYKESLILIPDGYQFKTAIALANLGATYEALNKLDSAFLFIQKALFLSREIEDDLGILINLSNSGNILRKQNKQVVALNLYNQAIVIADFIHRKDKKKEILLSISETYSELKQFEQSLIYYEKYSLLKDSLQSERTDEIIAKEEQKYKASEREKDIVKLKAEKNQQEQRELFYQYLIIGIITLVIVISIFVYLFILERNKQRELKNDQKVVHSMLDAEEKTKADISQEIHDNLGSKLTMVRTSIGRFKKLIPTDQYEDAKELIEQSENIARSISHKLFSSFLRDMGLPAAIKRLFDDLNKLESRKKYYFFTNIEEHKRLNWEAELNLFRITQELINNASKYANAERIDIELEMDNGKINYFYQDNGKGFDYKTVKKGVGLQSVRNRADRIGMKAYFNPTPNKGTKITIS